MSNTASMTDFFVYLEQHYGADHAQHFRDEYLGLPIGMCAEIVHPDPADWPQLWDEYDERLGIIAEERQPTEADVLAAWRSTLKEVNNEPADI